MTQTITIAPRFCGPPASGNGGYVSGRLARRLGGAVEVTLRLPPPLAKPLGIKTDERGLRLFDGSLLIAEARVAPLALDPPLPPAEAVISALPEVGDFGIGDYGTCFSCGRRRHPPDGLCVRPRWVSRDPPLVAALWTPHPDLADDHGRVPPEMLWATLDCPGGLAVLASAAESAMTGRMHAEVDDDVRPGEPYRIVAWQIGGGGRKRLAGTALFDRHGRRRGQCLATWIVLGAR
jgi:hypothetical protein